MALEKHDLHAEFPEYEQEIHELKVNNSRFARLFEDYHKVEHEVHRIEVGVENSSDDYLEEKKKERLALKDELFQMIKEYATA